MEKLLPVIAATAPRAIFVILFIVGIVIALARHGRHPLASRLAVIAFILLLAREIVSVASQAYVMLHTDLRAHELLPIVTAYNLAGLALSLAGTTLLAVAVFADRNPAGASAAAPATASASR